jgi:tryptophan-rich sensory protein
MHNILIPLFTFLVALIGSRLTSAGMKWYRSIKVPKWTPGGKVIGMIWTAIYILAAVSALIVWNQYGDQASIMVGLLFLLNGILNVLWSYIFFIRHDYTMAVFEMSALNITTVLLIYTIWPLSILAALLFVPYFIWVSLASYLLCKIKSMNV